MDDGFPSPAIVGGMAERIRAFAWGRTPLGPMEDWPQSLRTSVDIMLGSGHAMQIAWGDGRTFLYNDAYASMLGARHPIALGAPFHDAWPDVWHEIEPLVARVFTGETVRYEDMPLVMTRHGYPEQTWWNFSYSPIRNEEGHVAGLLNVTVDVTGQVRAQRAETALRESEARVRAFIDASADIIYRMSPDWSQMRQLDGQGLLSDTTEPSRTWMERYILAEDQDHVRAAIDQATATKTTFELDHRVYLANGSIGWTHCRAVPILDASGEILEWFGTGIDITARRESDERQTFLLKLSDSLKQLADPVEIMGTASRLLGEHLGVGRCGYGEVDATGVFFTVADDWTDGVMASLRGTLCLDDFGDALISNYRAGRTLIIDDVYADTRAEGVESAFEAIGGLQASLAVPLLKNGRLVSIFYIQQSSARHWTPADETLVRDIAERTWAAVERARAESALRESEARLTAAFESVPVGISVIGMDGVATLSNAVYRSFLPTNTIPSCDPARVGRWRSWDFYGRAVLPQDFPGARALRGERVVPGQEMLYKDDDGREIWTSVSTAPIRDATGAVTGAISVISDIDAIKRAAAALHESDARFAQFAASSSDAIWVRDAETLAFEFVSPAAEKIYGIVPERLMVDDAPLSETLLPEDRERISAGVRRAARGEVVTQEYRIRHPGDRSLRWIRSTNFPLTKENGKVRRIGAIAQDITDLKRAAEHQAVLLAELQHRVRNTLAVIRSIARRTAENSETVDDFRMHFDGRLSAFARTQAHVTRDPTHGIDLASIVADELLAHGAREGGQVTITGHEVRLTPKMADMLGLAIHELATNAVKHGALRDTSGRLAIAWRTEDENGDIKLHIDWTETLKQPLPASPLRAGFGTELLQRTLAYDLDAEVTLDFARSGLRCTIAMPLTSV